MSVQALEQGGSADHDLLLFISEVMMRMVVVWDLSNNLKRTKLFIYN
jgi:hypothetical protein